MLFLICVEGDYFVMWYVVWVGVVCDLYGFFFVIVAWSVCCVALFSAFWSQWIRVMLDTFPARGFCLVELC